MRKAPRPYVKLATLEQQGFFNVFLDDPVGKFKSGLEEELDLLKVIHDLDSFALVLVGRLYEPNVFLAVLGW